MVFIGNILSTLSNFISRLAFTLIISISYSKQLIASSIGEIITVDGKKYAISQFGSSQSEKKYFVRTATEFVAISRIKNITRVSTSASRFFYLIQLTNGNMETGRQGFLFYESILLVNQANGKSKTVFTPVIKDRKQKGLIFTALNTFDNSKRVIEITHLSNIDSISLNY